MKPEWTNKSFQELGDIHSGMVTRMQELADIPADKISDEQSAEFRSLNTDIDLLGKHRESLLRKEQAASAQAQLNRAMPAPLPNTPVASTGTVDVRSTPEYRSEYGQWLRNPRGQYRTLSLGASNTGGYLAPTAVETDFFQYVANKTFMFDKATRYALTGFGGATIPLETTAIGNAAFSTSTITLDVSQVIGTRSLTCRDMGVGMAVKFSLMNAVQMNVEQYVNQRLGDALAERMDYYCLVGNGSSVPLGVFTASSSGISTGQDVTAASATAITADELHEVVAKIDPKFITPDTAWILNPTVILAIRKLKNGVGDYLWKDQDFRTGVPATLLGFPVYVSAYAPGTITHGLYVAAFGNLKQYAIAHINNIQLQTTDEPISNSRTFALWLPWDGAPVIETAWARLITA